MITTLTSLFICINSINFTTFAEIDLTHTFVEERGLQENTWINLNCKSSSPACKKYLIRYEDAEKLEKILKELIKEIYEIDVEIIKDSKNQTHILYSR